MKIPAKDIAVLSGLSVLIALLRLHTYDEPLERDITYDAVNANELLANPSLYVDLFHSHPPAMVWTHAAFQTIFGYDEGAIYALGVVAAIVTTLGVYLAASAGQVHAATGLWAAAFWVAVSGAPDVQANQPNAEVYMNACVIWGLVVLMRDTGEGSGLKRALAAGACFALATFYKQVTIVAAPALALAHIAMPPGENPSRPRAVRQTIVIASVGAIAWLSFVGYHLRKYDFETLWGWFASFDLYYSGSLVANIILGLNPGVAFPPAMYSVFPLLSIAILGAALGKREKTSRSGALVFALLLACPVMVGLPGTFYPHYYQIWLAPLAIAAARALEGIHSRLDNNHPAPLKTSAGALLVFLAVLQISFYGLSPEEWSRMKYGKIFTETRRVGKLIGTLLLPDEKVYDWGMESGIYFYSRRRPASGLLWPSRTTLYGPLVDRHTQWLLKELSQNPPELMVVPPYYAMQKPAFLKWISEQNKLSDIAFEKKPDPVEFTRKLNALSGEQFDAMFERKQAFLNWILERYDPLVVVGASFKLYFRRGGALEKRLTASMKTNAPESDSAMPVPPKPETEMPNRLP